MSARDLGRGEHRPVADRLDQRRGALDRADRQGGEAPGERARGPRRAGGRPGACSRPGRRRRSRRRASPPGGRPRALTRSRARGACRRAGARGTGGRAGSARAAPARRPPGRSAGRRCTRCRRARAARCRPARRTASEVCAIPWPSTRPTSSSSRRGRPASTKRLITRAVSMSSSVKMRSPRPGLGRPTACISSRRKAGARPASRATWLSEWRPAPPRASSTASVGRRSSAAARSISSSSTPASRRRASSRSRSRVRHRSIQARIWSYTAGWLSRSKCVSAAHVVAVLDREAEPAPPARARGAGDADEQVAEDRAQRRAGPPAERRRHEVEARAGQEGDVRAAVGEQLVGVAVAPVLLGARAVAQVLDPGAAHVERVGQRARLGQRGPAPSPAR